MQNRYLVNGQLKKDMTSIISALEPLFLRLSIDNDHIKKQSNIKKC